MKEIKNEYEQIELCCEHAQNGRVDLLQTVYPQSLMYRTDGQLAPIHHAARYGQLEVVKYLVKTRKSCIDHLSCFGTTLQIAVNHEHFSIVKFLLDNGAKITGEDLIGLSILDAAILKCNLSIVEYLVFKGAKFPDFKFYNHFYSIDSPSYIDFALLKNRQKLAFLLVLLGYDVNKVEKIDNNYVSKLILKIKPLEASEKNIILEKIKENIKTVMEKTTITSLLCVKHSSLSSLSFYKNKYLRNENINMRTSYSKMLEYISDNLLIQCIDNALDGKNQINYGCHQENRNKK